MPKPYNIREIARFILSIQSEYEKCNTNIMRQLKLHKLLYFLQAQSLIIDGKPIFEESIRAANFGPIVDEIYGDVKFSLLKAETYPSLLEASIRSQIDLEDQALIKEVVDYFDSYSNLQLCNIIFNQYPFKIAYDNNCDISNEDLKIYFTDSHRLRKVKVWKYLDEIVGHRKESDYE